MFKHLQDHLITDISFSYDRRGLTASPFAHLDPRSVLAFLSAGRGALAHSGISATGFVHTALSPGGAARPDLQLFACPVDQGFDYGAGFRMEIQWDFVPQEA